jgi:hypothetical protein
MTKEEKAQAEQCLKDSQCVVTGIAELLAEYGCPPAHGVALLAVALETAKGLAPFVGVAEQELQEAEALGREVGQRWVEVLAAENGLKRPA